MEDRAVPLNRCFRYDGTNAEEIFLAGSDGEDGSWSYVEENGIMTITVDYGESIVETWSAPEGGGFILRFSGGVASGVTPEQFDENYYAMFSNLKNPAVQSSNGIEPIGTVGALGGTVTLSVELKPAFADDTYEAAAVISGGATLLGDLEVLSTTVVDENHVSVVVRNNGLTASSGGKVVVTAVN